MGFLRNGARMYLDIINKACKLSHLPGFRLGLINIMGTETATSLLALWDPFCALVDVLVASDNYYNQKDYQNDDGTGEDTTPPDIGPS